MSSDSVRQSASSTPVLPEASALESLAEDTLFQPTIVQRKLKGRLMARMADSVKPIEELSTEEVVALVGDRRVVGWMNNPSFRSWITNAEENRAKLEYLFSLALDTAEAILLDTEPKTASARVNAIKVIAELSAKFPRISSKDNYLDESVSKMNKHELEAFLSKQGIKLNTQASLPEPIDITPEKE